MVVSSDKPLSSMQSDEVAQAGRQAQAGSSNGAAVADDKVSRVSRSQEKKCE